MRCHVARYALVAVVAAASLLLAGCEGLQETIRVAADVIVENPNLIANEDDREKWVTGARAVKNLTSEIDTREAIEMGQSLAVRAFAAQYPMVEGVAA